MQIELRGTESQTFECRGTIDRDAARRLVPSALELGDGAVEVELLLFAMVGLGASKPVRIGPRFDYGEALWRVGVSWRGEPAWFSPVCDLDSRAVRTLGAWLVRYPVRTATISVESTRATVEVDGRALVVEAGALGPSPEPAPPRPQLVASSDRVFRIPWAETPAPWRHEVAIAIDDRGLGVATLGVELQWSDRALVHRGRIHRCGFARRA